MKKIYQQPTIDVIEVLADGMLCLVGSATGSANPETIEKLDEEQMVKSSSHSNPVQWEDWQ